MKQLNVAIIGAGVIAPAHIQAYRKLPGVTVKTICDLNPEKARNVAAQFGISHTETDYKKVFADPEIDAVSVCTDHESHSAITVAALDAGKHVLCEKPLSSSRENVDRMIEAGKRHPDLVFEGVFQHRFDGPYRYVRELLQSGRFGKVLTGALCMECLRTPDYYQDTPWRGTWAHEGGSLMMNQAIHFVDIFQWIMGGAEQTLGVFTNNAHQGIIETEDAAALSVKFQNGALGTIIATSGSHLGWEAELSFYGAESTLQMRDLKLLRFTSTDHELEKEVQSAFRSFENPSESGINNKFYYGTGHPDQIADFVDSIREHRAPFVRPEEARIAVDIAQSLYGR